MAKIKKSKSSSVSNSFRRANVKAKKPNPRKRVRLSAFEKEFDALLAKQLAKSKGKKDVKRYETRKKTSSSKPKSRAVKFRIPVKRKSAQKRNTNVSKKQIRRVVRKRKRSPLKFRTSRKNIVFTGKGQNLVFPKGSEVEILKRTFELKRAKSGTKKDLEEKISKSYSELVRPALADLKDEKGNGIYYLKMRYRIPGTKIDKWASVPRKRVSSDKDFKNVLDSFEIGSQMALNYYLLSLRRNDWQLKGFEFEFFSEESIKTEKT